MRLRPVTIPITIGRPDGLTQDEGKVMDALTDAVWHFNQLERTHPQELNEFIGGIHVCQGLLACRIAQRVHPEAWPTYSE